MVQQPQAAQMSWVTHSRVQLQSAALQVLPQQEEPLQSLASIQQEEQPVAWPQPGLLVAWRQLLGSAAEAALSLREPVSVEERFYAELVSQPLLEQQPGAPAEQAV